VELVATDEHKRYDAIAASGRRHEVIKHSVGGRVRGEVHTQNIESFRSLIKRGIMGSYRNVLKKYCHAT